MGISLSYCIGVYNEDKHLKNNLLKIDSILKNKKYINKFEIVVVDNGSSDNTQNVLKTIKVDTIRHFNLKEKGLGVAYQHAIRQSKYSLVILSAIDFPFGTSDIENYIKESHNADICFGSKLDARSKDNRSIQRKLMSKVYSFIVNSLFNIGIKDTQGSVIIKKSIANKLLGYAKGKDYFFNTQLGIYSRILDLKISEIPVDMNQGFPPRPSTISFVKDIQHIISAAIHEYLNLKLARYKKSQIWGS